MELNGLWVDFFFHMPTLHNTQSVGLYYWTSYFQRVLVARYFQTENGKLETDDAPFESSEIPVKSLNNKVPIIVHYYGVIPEEWIVYLSYR